MAKTFTPSQYLKLSREAIRQELPGVVADAWLKQLRETNSAGVFLTIPSFIPAKYHDYMQRAFATAVARVLFESTTQKVDYAERYRLAQKIK